MCKTLSFFLVLLFNILILLSLFLSKEHLLSELHPSSTEKDLVGREKYSADDSDCKEQDAILNRAYKLKAQTTEDEL
jgi:hypothetical protein